MNCLLPSEVSSTSISIEKFVAVRKICRRSTKAFNTPIPSFRESHWSMMPAGYPNHAYANAIDLNIMKRDIPVMDHSRLDAEELEDLKAFMALSADILSDLIDEEPRVYTVHDIKVRFK